METSPGSSCHPSVTCQHLGPGPETGKEPPTLSSVTERMPCRQLPALLRRKQAGIWGICVMFTSRKNAIDLCSSGKLTKDINT